MVVLLLVDVLFSRTPYLLLIDGRYRWAGKIKMASASTPSVNKPAKASFRPHSKAKANIKAQISGKLVTSGISDVEITAIYFEKTRLKK